MSHLYSLTTFVLSNMIIFEYHYISIINSHQSNCAGSLLVPLHRGICWNLCWKKTQLKPCFNLAPFLWKICNKITVVNFPNRVTLTSYNAVCGKPLKYNTYKKQKIKRKLGMVPQYLLMWKHCCTRTNSSRCRPQQKATPSHVRVSHIVGGRTNAFIQPISIFE